MTSEALLTMTGGARRRPAPTAGDQAPAPRPAGATGDRKVTLTLPAGVVRQLRARMAGEDTTMRALVLEALRQAGYKVPAAEIRDRRRAPQAGPGAAG